MAAVKKKLSTEKIMVIPLTDLHERSDHPIRMREDDSFWELVESIQESGVLVPGVVRTREEGGFEMIAGRRRKRASELNGLETMPVIVREMDDDQAVIEMVDSNVQREEILPCEKAAAYRMKLEAVKHQGARTDITSRQVGGKLDAAAEVGKAAGDSARQVQRYIRLTELSPELQQMVNEGKIAMTPAVELSYLKPEEQAMLLMTIDYEQATPSLSQAQRMKEQSQIGTLTEDSMLKIMCEQKKPCWDRVTLKGTELRKYFPENSTSFQIEQVIYQLLDRWYAQKHPKDKVG